MANSGIYWKSRSTFTFEYPFRRLRTFLHSAEVTILGLVYFLSFFYNAQIILEPPRLDFTLAVSQQNEVHITSVTPGGVAWAHGIQAGDRVLALNGQAPVTQGSEYWIGQSAQVQISTGAAISIDASMLPDGLNAWPLLVLSPWFFLFGLLVYLRCQDRSIARASLALFTSIAFALALAPAAIEERLLVTAVEFAAVALFAPCFLHFFLAFPAYRGSRYLHRAIFIPPLAVGLLGLLALWHPLLYGVAAMLRLIILLGYISVGVFLILYSLITERNTHHSVVIIGLGIVVSTLPFLVLYLIPMVFLEHPVLAAEYAILPLALLPISFAYAILRHNVFHIALLQRWLVHGLLYVAMVILYTSTIIKVIMMWFAEIFSAPLIITAIVALIVIVIGLTFQWLYKRTSRVLDQVFFKDSYDYHTVLQDLSHGLSTARDIDTLGIDLLCTFWELVNVEFAALLLRDKQNQGNLYLHAIVGVCHPALMSALTKIERNVPEFSSIVSLPIHNKSILTVPLRVHNFIVGYICLGPKVKGGPFRTQDRDLLNTLSVQIAAIIRNSQLVNDLLLKVNALDALTARLQNVQEQERIRIAADIHDEPLQTALHLQRELVTAVGGDERLLSIVPLSQTLIDQLRNVCTAMRPVALEDLGLIAALDALAQEQSDRRGVPIFLDIEIPMNDLVLPSSTELVLYRAAQEAINNALRHAHPQAIRINLCQQDDSVRLLVVDDGQGFAVPAQLDSLVVGGHLGLIGMHERVQHIGGKLDILSTPKQGTVVQLTIPLKRGSHDSGDRG